MRVINIIPIFLFHQCLSNPVFPSMQNGALRYCSNDNPCPRGESCMPDPFVPDVQACFRVSLSKDQKRAGSCPVGSVVAFRGQRCQFDQNCPTGQKCCSSGYGFRKTCLQPTPIPTNPTVTVLQDGSMAKTDRGFNFASALTLVQSGGKNFLVDTGNTGQKIQLIQGLQKSGLAIKDIDMLMTTHGHADHYSNAGAFADVPTIGSSFTSTGSAFEFNPLAQKQKYYLTKDVEVIQTPGHTLQDVSMIVRNTPQGTVAVVGDLLLNAQDAMSTKTEFAQDATAMKANKKLVVCLADYVVPGHGPMFKVTQEMRTTQGC